MKKAKGFRQGFVPGFMAAYQGTPILTAGELPGGGALFRTCARAAVEAEQLPLGCAFCGSDEHGIADCPAVHTEGDE